jgi:hypothetical protein
MNQPSSEIFNDSYDETLSPYATLTAQIIIAPFLKSLKKIAGIVFTDTAMNTKTWSDLSYSGSSGQLYFQAFEYKPYLAYNIYILVHTYKINKTYQL